MRTKLVIVLLAVTAATATALVTRRGRDRNIPVQHCLRLPTTLPTTAPSANDPAQARLWALLRQGGHVILLRHAQTEPGSGDPPGFNLRDRATQRNLSPAGQRQAQELGVLLRQVPIDTVLSSEYYRCRDTARLALGTGDTDDALNALAAEWDAQERQLARTRALMARARRPNAGNVVLVTHQQNIAALTQIVPQMGEAVVVTPTADGSFVVEGRLPLVPPPVQ